MLALHNGHTSAVQSLTDLEYDTLTDTLQFECANLRHEISVHTNNARYYADHDCKHEHWLQGVELTTKLATLESILGKLKG